jgi:trimeric autotransporter adhesin
MFSGRRLPLTLAFAGLLLLAFGAGCRGFFVKPTLSSLVVTPATASIQVGSTSNTQQFTAFGTYNDGSTGNPQVTWTSSDATKATITASGLATSVATGTATITAAATQNPSSTGTAQLTVTVGCITSITLQPASTITLSLGTSGQNTASITAQANTCNGQVDITDTATWTSSNTSVATVNGGLVTAAAQGTAIITASSGNVTSPGTTVNVGP